jgi:hypothetical protein
MPRLAYTEAELASNAAIKAAMPAVTAALKENGIAALKAPFRILKFSLALGTKAVKAGASQLQKGAGSLAATLDKLSK